MLVLDNFFGDEDGDGDDGFLDEDDDVYSGSDDGFGIGVNCMKLKCNDLEVFVMFIFKMFFSKFFIFKCVDLIVVCSVVVVENVK